MKQTLNKNKTHCKHGHPLSGENLFIDKDGWRRCRECMRRNNKNSAAVRSKKPFSELEYGEES